MGITSTGALSPPRLEVPPPSHRNSPPPPQPKRPAHRHSGPEPPACAPLAATPWDEFRERYEAVAQGMFSRHTFVIWAAAADRLERNVSPTCVGSVTPESLDCFEGCLLAAGYSFNRIRSELSRLHHAIIWACDAGYLNPATFSINPSPTFAARMNAIAFDDFERLCGSPLLADVPSHLPAFVEALRLEGVDAASLAIYREAIERLAAWASNQGRVAA